MSSGSATSSTVSPSELPAERLLPDGGVSSQLPAIVPAKPAKPVRWPWGLALVAVLAMALAGVAWWLHRVPPVPPGIAYSNGRLEADPIDIATKFAGRVAELRVDEGDTVGVGQVLALMDTRDLQKALEKAEAEVRQQQRAVVGAEANLEQFRAQVRLAEQQMERTNTLLKNGWTTQEVSDQRRQQLDTAHALERAAAARVSQLQHAIQAALREAELLKINIADNTLIAPRDGRIQYRLASVGEVLPAGGKVFTLLDAAYLYMDIYLPTAVAGRVRAGQEGRIVLDAYPAQPIIARVTFVSPRAQFTPKMVETRTERDKLMFRVRVRIDPTELKGVAAGVPSGLPGMAYVRFDDEARWPKALQAGL
jgi:HlyD family secretion protein